MPCWCQGNCPHIALPRKLKAEKKTQAAMQALRVALTKAPNCPLANIELGRAMTEGNQATFAQVHFERAALSGLTPDLQLDIAHNFRMQARLQESAVEFEKAIKMAPTNPRAWGQLIAVLEMAGELGQAENEFEIAAVKFPELPPAIRRPGALTFAALGRHDEAIKLLDQDNLLPLERLDRGRYKEKIGDYAGAWEDWTTAKAELAEKHGHIYWREHFVEQFSALFEISQPARYRMLDHVDEITTPAPIFVSGFPRSGTTLVENIMSQHSLVVAGDELMGINDVITSMRRYTRAGAHYPAALMATTLGDNVEALPLLQQLYLFNARRRIDPPGSAIYFTDKMPLNEVHWPLISLLFPQQPFIYVRRHPLDIIVSHMGHLLANGGHYAQSLETVAEHYAGVDALLQHYKRSVPMHRFFECRYEALIKEPEIMVRHLAEHCDLEPEPAMLEPHTNPRNARTISYAQVRQPLSDKSIGRWRNFADWLKPVFPIIAPICKREGYDL